MSRRAKEDKVIDSRFEKVNAANQLATDAAMVFAGKLNRIAKLARTGIINTSIPVIPNPDKEILKQILDIIEEKEKKELIKE